MPLKTLALSGGGTGGHFYPLLAFAEYLKKTAEVELIFFGDKRGIEYRKKELLKNFDKTLFLPMEKFKGRSSLGKLIFALRTFGVSLKIAKHLKGKEFKTLVFGGYTSSPTALATRLLKKPLFIHEQNAVPGAANRMLSKFAKRVFVAFPNAARHFKRAEVVGMPIREELKKIARASRGEILKKLNWEDKPTLLILGGSQGAKRLNALAIELSAKLKDVRIIHITGERNFEETKREYKKVKKTAEVVLLPYTDRIGELMRVSHFAISRAGASTSFELALFGLPTLFVPYPYAVYDHQYHNARYFADGGGAFVVREEELNTERAISLIEEHLRDEELLKQRSEAMKKLFIPDAEEKIVQILLTN